MTRAADPVAQAANDQVDTNASRVFIKVGSATVIGHQHGVEGHLKSGNLVFGGSGELVFDMPTFTADTAAARQRVGLGKPSASEAATVTKNMRSADVLDVAHFPTATFQIITVKPLDGQANGAAGMYQLAGKFTLHGTEKDLQLQARLDPPEQHGQMKLSGSFKIKQSDYGIKPFSTFGGFVKVADELEITGDLLLVPPGR